MINTYNESSLHNTLKLYYSQISNGQTEVKMDGHIYDVLGENGEIIEIQTKNLSSLYRKISDILQKGKKIKLVHPLVISTRINNYNREGKKLSSRKSPKKNTIYSMFSELTGIYPLLLDKNFSLEIVQINMIEERLKVDEKVQSKNNRRRFKRDWIKNNKRLENIICFNSFKNTKDYLSLLPDGLEQEFCAKDICDIFKEQKNYSASMYNDVHLMLWVFVRMNIIEFVKTKKRAKYYKIIQLS